MCNVHVAFFSARSEANSSEVNKEKKLLVLKCCLEATFTWMVFNMQTKVFLPDNRNLFYILVGCCQKKNILHLLSFSLSCCMNAYMGCCSTYTIYIYVMYVYVNTKIHFYHF